MNPNFALERNNRDISEMCDWPLPWWGTISGLDGRTEQLRFSQVWFISGIHENHPDLSRLASCVSGRRREGGCGGWSGGKSLAWAAFEGKSDQLINWRWHWAKWLAGCGKMRETKDNWTFSTPATLIATFSTQALGLHALLAWAIGGALAWAIGGAQRKITKLSLLLFKFHPTICFWACFVLCVRRFNQI